MLLRNRSARLAVLCVFLLSVLVVTYNLKQTSTFGVKTQKLKTLGNVSIISLHEKVSSPTPTTDSDDNCTICLSPEPVHGVEDLFCMDKPKYIKDLKNPCWLESGRLRCLPYFHILGCAKCATTDLATRLSLHPDIIKPDGYYDKEALWWSWSRYGLSAFKPGPLRNFKQYKDTFKPLAKILEEGMKNETFNNSHLITLDGSPPDFWDFRSWPLLPQNHQRKEPCVLTPHLMNHIYANPKFILIFRNPTERLLSSYFFHKMGDSAEDFHEDVKTSLDILRDCQKKQTRRQCFFNSSVYYELPTRLHFGCYSVYLAEWFKVFPRSHFLFLKTEEYTSHIGAHLKLIFTFLELSPVSTIELNNMRKIKKVRVTSLKKKVGEMLPETKKLLDNFYAPCNKELADMLGDDKFLWNDRED